MGDRLSQPAPFDGGMTYGGIGVIPRRQQDPILSGLSDALCRLGLPGMAGGTLAGNLIATMDPRYAGLAAAAQEMPLRLLRVLLAQDGMAQMAAVIEAGLAFGAKKVRFVAVKDYRTGKGTIDDDGTAEIARVFSLYQAGDTRAQVGESVGGLSAPDSLSSPIPAALPMLLHAADRINDTGQVLFEAVGDVGVGVTGIYDFDALTCRYRDAEINAPDGRHTRSDGRRVKIVRVFEQQSKDAKADPKTGAVDGWKIIGGPGIASVAWKASTANPYGGPRNGAALPYLLRKAAGRRDWADWRHNCAFPKVIIEQLMSNLIKLAVDNPKLLVGTAKDGGNLKPHEFAQAVIDKTLDNLEANVSQNVWAIGEGKAYPLNVSDISGLTDILKMERIEEIQSVNMLPALVGVTDGGTQAYGEVQWLAETQVLALQGAYCAAPVVQVGNYHFRLRGEDLIVQAEFDDLPPIDPQKSATARNLIMQIEEHLAVIGVNSPEDFAMRVSDGGAADEPRLKDYLARLVQTLAAKTMAEPAPMPAE